MQENRMFSDVKLAKRLTPAWFSPFLAALLMYGALDSVQAFINFSSVVNVLIYAVLGFFVYGGLVLVLRVLDFQELKSVLKK